MLEKKILYHNEQEMLALAEAYNLARQTNLNDFFFTSPVTGEKFHLVTDYVRYFLEAAFPGDGSFRGDQ